jgi:hypothetical protein
LLLVLLTACAPTAYPPDRYQSGINPLRIPTEPVAVSGAFACTANIEAGLPAITWRRIPFRQEGDKLTGLYAFKDSFGYQDSVIFSGTLGRKCASRSDRSAQGRVIELHGRTYWQPRVNDRPDDVRHLAARCPFLHPRLDRGQMRKQPR